MRTWLYLSHSFETFQIPLLQNGSQVMREVLSWSTKDTVESFERNNNISNGQNLTKNNHRTEDMIRRVIHSMKTTEHKISNRYHLQQRRRGDVVCCSAVCAEYP